MGNTAKTNSKQTIAGGFRVIQELGRGAMGVVYLAEQVSMDRRVALKILPPKWSANENRRKRFIREARSAGKLSHPNLVAVHDVGHSKGMYYISMQFIDGVTAGNKMKAEGPIPEDQLRKIAKEMAGALGTAHAQNILHRDVKPDNILLDKSGTSYLADLGLARRVDDDSEEENDAGDAPLSDDGSLTAAGAVIGTPHYMSPEQIKGKKLDPRSDLYSLGATLYALASGHTPFLGKKSMDIMQSALLDEPTPLGTRVPDLSSQFIAIINKLMQKNPDDRYATAAELIDALDKPLPDLKGKTTKLNKGIGKSSKRPTGKRSGVLRGSKSNSVMPIAVAAVIVVVGGVFFLSRSDSNKSEPEKTNKAHSAKKDAEEKKISRPAEKPEKEPVVVAKAEPKKKDDVSGEKKKIEKPVPEPKKPKVNEEWLRIKELVQSDLTAEKYFAAMQNLEAYLKTEKDEAYLKKANHLKTAVQEGIETEIQTGSEFIREALEARNFPEAKTLVEKLADRVGKNHPALLELQKKIDEAESAVKEKLKLQEDEVNQLLASARDAKGRNDLAAGNAALKGLRKSWDYPLTEEVQAEMKGLQVWLDAELERVAKEAEAAQKKKEQEENEKKEKLLALLKKKGWGEVKGDWELADQRRDVWTCEDGSLIANANNGRVSLKLKTPEGKGVIEIYGRYKEDREKVKVLGREIVGADGYGVKISNDNGIFYSSRKVGLGGRGGRGGRRWGGWGRRGDYYVGPVKVNEQKLGTSSTIELIINKDNLLVRVNGRQMAVAQNANLKGGGEFIIKVKGKVEIQNPRFQKQ